MKRNQLALAFAAWATCAIYASGLSRVSAAPAVLAVPAGDLYVQSPRRRITESYYSHSQSW